MKNIIITGASRGIGYEMVKQLSSEGHFVLALSRNAEKLAELKAACHGNRGEVSILAVDLCDPETPKKVKSIFVDAEKPLDILINNAGALLNKPFAEITQEEQLYIYRVNVFSVADLIKELIPLLQKSSQAHVVNIGSMGGYQGSAKFPGLSIYSSSKAALASLTECLAEEYKEDGIKFNCLCLGAVQTEMLEEAFPGYQAPLSAEEMATFIGGFALNTSAFINGKVLPISISTP